MSRQGAVAAVRGQHGKLVAGVSWLPADALASLVFGTGAEGPSESLEAVVRALSLDFAFVPAEAVWAEGAVVPLHAADAAAVWAIPGVLSRIADEVGWTETLRMSASEPGALAAGLAEALHEALVDVRRGVSAGADIVLVADELAGAAGPLVAPDYALDALVPCYQHLAAEAEKGGAPAALHSDGDVRVLMPAFQRAGLSALHVGGLGPDAFAASLAAARVAGLVVLGGIEAATLLEGARHAGERVGRAAVSGGLIVCDDGGLTRPEEVAAYATALEAAHAAFSANGERA